MQHDNKILYNLSLHSPFSDIGEAGTKTSSNASDEAPERARKDTSEEAKLLLCGSAILRVIPMKFLRLSFDASHDRRFAAREICAQYIINSGLWTEYREIPAHRSIRALSAGRSL